MTVPFYRLLETLVDLFDEDDEPVAPDRLADRLDEETDAVREQLEALRSHDMVTATDDEEFVPTVTGRELLDLDVDEPDFIVIETPEDDEDES